MKLINVAAPKSTHCAIPDAASPAGVLVSILTCPAPELGLLLMSTGIQVGAEPAPLGSGADERNCAQGAKVVSKLGLGTMFCASAAPATPINRNTNGKRSNAQCERMSTPHRAVKCSAQSPADV